MVGLLILRWRASTGVIAACLAVNIAANFVSAYTPFDCVFYSALNIVLSVATAAGARRWCGAAVDLSRSRRLVAFALVAACAAAT